MNDQLQRFARDTLKDGLARLPDRWQRTFKLMYGSATNDIATVVDKMPAEKLDWAMQQVENSLRKLGIDTANAG